MPASAEAFQYRDLLLFLATAGVIVPLFQRLRISPVLGFLAAGVMLGPYGFGYLAQDVPWLSALTITNTEQIAPVAELGVVFLLFMIGLELSWERLMRMRRLIFGFGALQVVASTAALGGIAFLLGQTASAALVLGSALALSSTAIVIPVLAERKRLRSGTGRACFGVLLFQDLMVAPLMVMVSVLAAKDGTGIGFGLIYAFVPAVAALAATVILGRLLVRPLFRLVAAADSTELFMAVCLLVVIGTGVVTALSGQSMALGAFIAGLLLAETEYRREVEVTIEPFKGLLLGVFFVAVGVGLDISRILASPLLILGIVIGLIVVKTAVVMVAAKAVGLAGWVGREVGLTLGPGGEFAFVLLASATAAKIVPEIAVTTAAVAVTLSMFTIPGLVRLAERLAPRQADDAKLAMLAPPPDDGQDRVLLVGFGRVGQLVGDMLTRHDIPYLAVDRDPELVARERAAGKPIYYGDAARRDYLRRCGIAHARGLVVTMDSASAIEAVVRAGRAEQRAIPIVARARDAAHATKLYRLGATDAVPETIEASLQLSEALLIDIGVPAGLVIASIHEKRDEFRRLLQSPEQRGEPRHAVRMARRLRDRASAQPKGD
jgi:CPA2 family monovalent cation:H+ antiporter-2